MLIASLLLIPPSWSAAAVEPAHTPADQNLVIHHHFDGGTEGGSNGDGDGDFRYLCI